MFMRPQARLIVAAFSFGVSCCGTNLNELLLQIVSAAGPTFLDIALTDLANAVADSLEQQGSATSEQEDETPTEAGEADEGDSDEGELDTGTDTDPGDDGDQGDAEPFRNRLERAFGVADARDFDPADADGEPVALELAPANPVGVAIDPQHADARVIEHRQILDPRLGKVNRDDLAGERVLVLEAREPDLTPGDAKVPCQHAQHVERRERSLLEEHPDVIALADGRDERHLLNKKIPNRKMTKSLLHKILSNRTLTRTKSPSNSDDHISKPITIF